MVPENAVKLSATAGGARRGNKTQKIENTIHLTSA